MWDYLWTLTPEHVQALLKGFFLSLRIKVQAQLEAWKVGNKSGHQDADGIITTQEFIVSWRKLTCILYLICKLHSTEAFLLADKALHISQPLSAPGQDGLTAACNCISCAVTGLLRVHMPHPPWPAAMQAQDMHVACAAAGS